MGKEFKLVWVHEMCSQNYGRLWQHAKCLPLNLNLTMNLYKFQSLAVFVHKMQTTFTVGLLSHTKSSDELLFKGSPFTKN